MVQLNLSDKQPHLSIIEQPGAVVLPPPQRPAELHPRDAAQKLADDMVKQAELQKAELAKPPGEIVLDKCENIDGSLDYLHNMGSAHVDTITQGKIKADQYVELHRLLPRDFDLIDKDENLSFV